MNQFAWKAAYLDALLGFARSTGFNASEQQLDQAWVIRSPMIAWHPKQSLALKRIAISRIAPGGRPGGKVFFEMHGANGMVEVLSVLVANAPTKPIFL
jgi:hypothetical protein